MLPVLLEVPPAYTPPITHHLSHIHCTYIDCMLLPDVTPPLNKLHLFNILVATFLYLVALWLVLHWLAEVWLLGNSKHQSEQAVVEVLPALGQQVLAYME